MRTSHGYHCYSPRHHYSRCCCCWEGAWRTPVMTPRAPGKGSDAIRRRYDLTMSWKTLSETGAAPHAHTGRKSVHVHPARQTHISKRRYGSLPMMTGRSGVNDAHTQ
eukprot:53855-Eustigmatos_ZCMA.PRE.1